MHRHVILKHPKRDYNKLESNKLRVVCKTDLKCIPVLKILSCKPDDVKS